jgi:superfamily II DNA or RNA helicase
MHEATSAPTLRPYQVDALEDVWTAFTRDRHNRVLVKMPTGTGKTVMFAEMLRHYAERWECLLPTYRPNRGARMLVIAHREELLDQAADKISKANRGLMVSIEQGDRYANKYSDVVIASIQTLQAMKFRRLKRLLEQHTFRLVIVDEAHHAAAASYRTALVHLGFLPPADASESEEVEAADFDDVAEMEAALKGWDATAPRDRLLVGVTATPNRSDAIGLGCVFQTIAYNYALKAAIDDGYLVPITPWVVESDVSLDAVKMTAGDFNQKDLAQAVNNTVRNDLALAAWREHADGLSTIAFTVDVAHAHAMAETFRADGVPAEAISGETPREDRRAILERYRRGTVEVLCNCMVLTEGTDLPRTRCILHAKPTKSATLYEQMTGRGLRLYEGKPDCIVIDIVDVARRHSLQTAPVLYGLPPGLMAKGEDLEKLQAALEEFRDKYPTLDVDSLLATGRLTLEQLQAKASTFDIWKVPDLGDGDAPGRAEHAR